VSARAHAFLCARAKICMRVRVPKFVSACSCQNLYARSYAKNLYARAHARICMRVHMPEFVCALARQNLYARAHAKICMRFRMPKFGCEFWHTHAHTNFGMRTHIQILSCARAKNFGIRTRIFGHNFSKCNGSFFKFVCKIFQKCIEKF
jgi:hypothetical protein